MSSSIILNSSNIVPNSNNTTLKYKFKTPQRFDDGSQVAVSSIQMYNSVFNIDKKLYNNNTFNYYWLNTVGALDTTKPFTVTIPDGNYTTADLNEVFMSVMLKNKHYLISAQDTTKYTFFYAFTDNPTTLKCRFTAYPFKKQGVLGSAAGKYFYPNGTAKQDIGSWILPPDSSNILGMVDFLPDTQSKLAYFLGFTGRQVYKTPTAYDNDITIRRKYPNPYGFNEDGTTIDATTPYNVEGESIPVQLPISSIICTCNLAKNELSYPDNILHSFVFKSDSGYLNSEEPTNYNWMKIQPGIYNEVIINFLDQDLGRINIRDSQMLIQLVFRQVVN